MDYPFTPFQPYAPRIFTPAEEAFSAVASATPSHAGRVEHGIRVAAILIAYPVSAVGYVAGFVFGVTRSAFQSGAIAAE